MWKGLEWMGCGLGRRVVLDIAVWLRSLFCLSGGWGGVWGNGVGGVKLEGGDLFRWSVGGRGGKRQAGGGGGGGEVGGHVRRRRVLEPVS